MSHIQVQLAGLTGVRQGDPELGSPPVVLLHGLSFDHRLWAPVLPAIAAREPERAVLALDLPGHGGSAPAPSYRLGAVVDTVHDALVAAGVEQPVLVGHSVAAVIATIYAS